LPAIGAPRGVVHNHAFAAGGLGWNRGEAEQGTRGGRGDQVPATHNRNAFKHYLPHRRCLAPDMMTSRSPYCFLRPYAAHSAATPGTDTLAA